MNQAINYMYNVETTLSKCDSMNADFLYVFIRFITFHIFVS
jgi:hypothetical protein